MALPALAQQLGAAPAIMELQIHPEQIAQLAVEVRHARLGSREHADLHIPHVCEPLGQQAQGDRLAEPRRAVHIKIF